MVFGAIGKSNIQRVKENLSKIVGPDEWNNWVQAEADFFCLCYPLSDDTHYKRHHFWVSDDGLEGLFWEGEIYNWAEFEKLHGELPKA